MWPVQFISLPSSRHCPAHSRPTTLATEAARVASWSRVELGQDSRLVCLEPGRLSLELGWRAGPRHLESMAAKEEDGAL